MKWILKEYMARANINSYDELSKESGIKRATLFKRIREPRSIKAFEIDALDSVLHFSTDDLAKLARGQG
jgi:hypothetical protein